MRLPPALRVAVLLFAVPAAVLGAQEERRALRGAPRASVAASAPRLHSSTSTVSPQIVRAPNVGRARASVDSSAPPDASLADAASRVLDVAARRAAAAAGGGGGSTGMPLPFVIPRFSYLDTAGSPADDVLYFGVVNATMSQFVDMSSGVYPASPIVPPCMYTVNATFADAGLDVDVAAALRDVLAAHPDATCRVDTHSVIVVAWGAFAASSGGPTPPGVVAVPAANYVTTDATAITRGLGFAFGLSTSDRTTAFYAETVASGHPMDIMGYATVPNGHYAPVYKHVLGWLPDASVVVLQPPYATGGPAAGRYTTVDIVPVDGPATAASGFLGLRTPSACISGVGCDTGRGWLAVTQRARFPWATDALVLEELTADGAAATSNVWVDTTPIGLAGDDYAGAVLPPGAAFLYGVAGARLLIENLGGNGSKAGSAATGGAMSYGPSPPPDLHRVVSLRASFLDDVWERPEGPGCVVLPPFMQPQPAFVGGGGGAGNNTNGSGIDCSGAANPAPPGCSGNGTGSGGPGGDFNFSTGASRGSDWGGVDCQEPASPRPITCGALIGAHLSPATLGVAYLASAPVDTVMTVRACPVAVSDGSTWVPAATGGGWWNASVTPADGRGDSPIPQLLVTLHDAPPAARVHTLTPLRADVLGLGFPPEGANAAHSACSEITFSLHADAPMYIAATWANASDARSGAATAFNVEVSCAAAGTSSWTPRADVFAIRATAGLQGVWITLVPPRPSASSGGYDPRSPSATPAPPPVRPVTLPPGVFSGAAPVLVNPYVPGASISWAWSAWTLRDATGMVHGYTYDAAANLSALTTFGFASAPPGRFAVRPYCPATDWFNSALGACSACPSHAAAYAKGYAHTDDLSSSDPWAYCACAPGFARNGGEGVGAAVATPSASVTAAVGAVAGQPPQPQQCTACPPGTFKSRPGNNMALCLPCTGASAGSSACASAQAGSNGGSSGDGGSNTGASGGAGASAGANGGMGTGGTGTGAGTNSCPSGYACPGAGVPPTLCPGFFVPSVDRTQCVCPASHVDDSAAGGGCMPPPLVSLSLPPGVRINASAAARVLGEYTLGVVQVPGRGSPNMVAYWKLAPPTPPGSNGSDVGAPTPGMATPTLVWLPTRGEWSLVASVVTADGSVQWPGILSGDGGGSMGNQSDGCNAAHGAAMSGFQGDNATAPGANCTGAGGATEGNGASDAHVPRFGYVAAGAAPKMPPPATFGGSAMDAATWWARAAVDATLPLGLAPWRVWAPYPTLFATTPLVLSVGPPPVPSPDGTASTTPSGSASASTTPSVTGSSSTTPSNSASATTSPSATSSRTPTASSSGSASASARAAVNFFASTSIIVVRLGEPFVGYTDGYAQPVFLDEYALPANGLSGTLRSTTPLPASGDVACTLATGKAISSPTYYW